MSRRAAVIEEEFDDDTDLPLPALPNTGSRGPLLQQLGDDDDDEDESDSDDQRPGPASPSRPSQFPGSSNQDRPTGTVTDITPYKTWTCIYPIYLDAKRPYGTGQRRVARAKALWWPLSKDIAEAANRLGLGTLHEVNKAHPRDWENPGRVRVQWKKNGKLVNPMVKNKKQLLEVICFQIQHAKPECIPRPPYTFSTSSAPLTTAPANPTSTTSASSKGKQPLTTKANPSAASPNPKSSAAPPTQSNAKGDAAKDSKSKPARRPLPVPPEPVPPLANRISAYSPALSTGVLLETIKAGMNATETPGMPGLPAANAGMGKGKRKVVRVRG